MKADEPIPNIASYFSLGIFRITAFIGLFLLINAQLPFPAALLFFLLILTEGSQWWSRWGLRRLKLKKQVSPQRLFPGEEARMTWQLTNAKLLPSLLSWSQFLPPELEWMVGEGGTALKNIVTDQSILKSHSTLNLEYPLRAHKRGYFSLPPASIVSRDGLGLFANQTVLEGEQWIIVYPALIPLPQLSLNPSDLMGDQARPRPIQPDPVRVAELREYTPEMPAKLIHWKASVQKDYLLARVLEASSELRLCIALDATPFLENSVREENFEKALSVAATLACWAEDLRVAYGLYINATRKASTGPVVIPLNKSLNRTSLVLESLARTELNVSGSLPELFQFEPLPWGASLLIIGNGCPMDLPPGVDQVIYYSCLED